MNRSESQNERQAARRTNLSRRHFLRGLGACVALPAFESLISRTTIAQTAGEAGALASTATGAPLRTAFVYFPNGAIPAQWWPKGDGADFKFGSTLAPLEPLKAQLQVIGGLDDRNADPGRDGSGDHARANGTFLTGVRLKKSATDIRAGTSIDQVMAREIGHLTRFPSLELSCDYIRKSGACDAGYSCAYQYNISWKNESTPMAAEFSPRRAFERLFGEGEHGQRRDNFARRQAEERSILDFVMDDARSMSRRISPRDRQKLDQYLTGMREIETRIQASEKFGKTADPNVETPQGVPSSYAEHVKLMYDIMLLAFQTDSTRVATLMLAHDGSNRPFADEIGIPEGHHDLSHHKNIPDLVAKVARIDRWYVQQFSRFLQKLADTKDTDGNSLLHNSQIVYGSGNADGNRHTHHNLPILLAGAAGGAFTPGRYVKVNSKPTSNLFVEMARRAGMTNVQRFGDSTGGLSEVGQL